MFFSWKTCNVSEKMLVCNWRISLYTRNITKSWLAYQMDLSRCMLYVYLCIYWQSSWGIGGMSVGWMTSQTTLVAIQLKKWNNFHSYVYIESQS
jgi:hypothetical protein